ncbi:hypothetical protein K9M78_02965 [Candidatus Bipolaricaulota bacterium]|nr:hypothetical protein [Candidatus Bipolaricaulota bacterium]
MRKPFIVALVVILASTLSIAGFAAEDTAEAYASFNVNSTLSLPVINGQVVDFGAVTPGESYEKKGGTKLKVSANRDLSWVITTSKSSTTLGENEMDALVVELGTVSGTGRDNNIKVDYILNVPEEMPSGNHTVTVTFTASAD